jgi:hypothetical protein
MIQANGDLFKVCPFGLGVLYFIRLDVVKRLSTLSL